MLIHRTCWLFPLVLALCFSAGCGDFNRVKGHGDKPYNVKIMTRDRWPEGVPLRARIEYDGPWFERLPVRAIARAQLERGEPLSEWVPPLTMLVTWSPEYIFGDRTEVAGHLPAGASSVQFDALIRGDHGSPFPLWKDTVDVPVQSVATIAEAMTPVADSEIDAALSERRAMTLTRRRWAKSDRAWEGWHVSFAELPHAVLSRTDLTFGVTIDVLRDGEVMTSTAGWWRSHDYTGRGAYSIRGHMHDHRMLRLEGNLNALDSLRAGEQKWTMRVRSNPEMALRDFENDRYWDGEVVLPLIAEEVLVESTPDGWERTRNIVHPRDEDSR